MDLNEKLKKELKENFLKFKQEKLIALLIDFIENKSKLLIENPEDLKVITFEVDSPFEFIYVAYPESSVISQDYWLNQFTIDASEDDDESKLQTILNNNNFEEDLTWEIYSEMEKDFFSKCWRIAKKKTESNFRCFFLEHDVYRGIDADTGKEIDSEEIIDVLKKENFEFKILDKPIVLDKPVAEEAKQTAASTGFKQWLISLFTRK